MADHFVEDYVNTFLSLLPEDSKDSFQKEALFLQKKMSGSKRVYHNITHVLDVAEGLDPLGKIAAYYHDIIYLSLDGMPDDCYQDIFSYIKIEDIVLHKSYVWPLDLPLQGAAFEVFVIFSEDEQKSVSITNEFLSALFVACRLKGVLTKEQITAISSCIYATIPFKGRSSPMDHLAQKLRSLGYKESEIYTNVCRAVAVANKDIGNFASFQYEEFMKNSQNLLQEDPLYLVLETRELAIKKMKNFLSSLSIDDIFYSFEGFPENQKILEMKERAQKNIYKFLSETISNSRPKINP